MAYINTFAAKSGNELNIVSAHASMMSERVTRHVATPCTRCRCKSILGGAPSCLDLLTMLWRLACQRYTVLSCRTAAAAFKPASTAAQPFHHQASGMLCTSHTAVLRTRCPLQLRSSTQQQLWTGTSHLPAGPTIVSLSSTAAVYSIVFHWKCSEPPLTEITHSRAAATCSPEKSWHHKWHAMQCTQPPTSWFQTTPRLSSFQIWQVTLTT